MTPDKANRIIAEAVGEPWCGAMGRYTYGGGWSLNTIVDFTDSAFTLRLIQWAAKQEWWDKPIWAPDRGTPMCEVHLLTNRLICQGVNASSISVVIRDLIAEAIQEQSDGSD